MTTPGPSTKDAKQEPLTAEQKKNDAAAQKLTDTLEGVGNVEAGTPDAAKISENLSALDSGYDVSTDPVVPSSAVGENIAVELASDADGSKKGDSPTLNHLREMAKSGEGNGPAGFAAKADEDDKDDSKK